MKWKKGDKSKEKKSRQHKYSPCWCLLRLLWHWQAAYKLRMRGEAVIGFAWPSKKNTYLITDEEDMHTYVTLIL